MSGKITAVSITQLWVQIYMYSTVSPPLCMYLDVYDHSGGEVLRDDNGVALLASETQTVSCVSW